MLDITPFLGRSVVFPKSSGASLCAGLNDLFSCMPFLTRVENLSNEEAGYVASVGAKSHACAVVANLRKQHHYAVVTTFSDSLATWSCEGTLQWKH
jgi:hypothetical protein